MAVLNYQLLVAGGNSKTAAQYSPKTDSWFTLNSPTLQHSFGALALLNSQLYLIGGHLEDRVEEYNLPTRTWSTCDQRAPKKLIYLHSLALDM